MHVALLAMLACLAEPAEADTIVVCPEAFRETMVPWVEYRTRQGHRIAFESNLPTAEDIRQRIRRRAASGNVRFVVLVGDADPEVLSDPVLCAYGTPTHRATAEVIARFGPESHLSTDSWYADLDDDQIPDLAVGRLPADTPRELARIIDKTLAYEQSEDFGPWRRQIDVVAGAGGMSPIIDAMLESTTRMVLAQNLPPEYNVSATYASWRSPYCPDPRRFRETAVEQLNEGCLFWVYVGHGYHVTLDRVWVPGGSYPILATPDVARLKCQHGLPVALFLCCYAGAMDAVQDCLAEEAVRAPGAPVASIAASRTAMPYGMAVLGSELIEQFFRRRTPTLGESLLNAKRAMLKPGAAAPNRAMLDALATVASPNAGKLADERREHAMMFNLFGDPLLQLRFPKPVDLKVADSHAPGGTLEVRGTSPVEGEAVIELVVPRDRANAGPTARTEYPTTDDGLAEFQRVHQQANEVRLSQAVAPVKDGHIEAELPVPESAAGACHVRVYVAGREDYAQGAAGVTIRK
jgi:hypothetical protein